MLKQLRLIPALLFVVTLLMSCEKEYSVETGGIGGGPGGTFRAKIDGTQWVADIVKSARRTGGVIELKGSNANGKQIVLTLKDSGVHNYQLRSTSVTNFGVYVDSATAPFLPYSTNQFFNDSLYGNVNITAIDTVRKTISGNFKMRVFRTIDSDEKNITEGVFTNISYGPPSVTPPPPPAGNTFFVKVNGVEFVDNNLTATEAINNIVIMALNNGGSAVTLTMPNTLTAGTYSFDLVNQIVGNYAIGTSIYMSDAGTLVIQEHNTTTNFLRGTFSFTALDFTSPGAPSVSLTEGSFAVTYN